MLFGTDYYPEHWSPDRLSVDIQLMKEAGINQVRMAEFAWSLLEPQDNHFDFTWLDEVVNLLGEAGIYTILGTPTAAPPKWLIDLHPEILPIDREGRTRGFGNRHHRCHNNPVFDKYMTRIINRMVKHYKDNSYVRAWQTDNEIGAHDSTYCYCHHCESAFQEWLRIKYISIDTLNKEWGTVFWSQTYNSFESVSLPRFGTIENDKICAFNPGLMLDFKRFSSDAAVDYQNRQIALIKGSTRQLVTHNTMQHLVFDDIDYYEFSKELDIVSLDNYPSPLQFRIKNPAHMHQAAAFCLDHTRGLKGKNFWIMEQQSGRPGWNLCFGNTTSGQIRLWSHQATAHGAEGLMYFRWRASTIGAEQYWYGILDHDGIPRDRYEEIRKTGKELQGISDLIEASSNTSVIAIITDYDNIWGHKLTPHAFGFSYNELLLGYYTSLVNLHYNVDIVSTDADLSNYELVIAPALNIVDENLRTKLEDYCSKGGHLLLTFLSGTRHKNNSITTQSFPGYFKDLCGITVTDYDPFVRNTLMTDGTEQYNASIWCDRIETETAQTIATYDSSQFKGFDAVTENTYGAGTVTYIGANMDTDGLTNLMEEITEQIGLTANLPSQHQGIEAVRKQIGERIYLYILNHHPTPKEVELNATYRNLLNQQSCTDTLRLNGFDVAVLEPVNP